MNSTRSLLSVLLAVALSLLLAGCASLLGPLRDETVEEQTPLAGNTSSSTHSLASRIAVRAVFDSPLFDDVSESFTRRSLPSVKYVTDTSYAVVFSVEPDEGAESSDGFLVYPYVVFVVDVASREVLEVIEAIPSIEQGTLLIESLVQKDSFTQDMTPGILE